MEAVQSYNDKICRYFNKAGPKNTKGVLDIAARRAKELGIRKCLVATCSGKTVLAAL